MNIPNNPYTSPSSELSENKENLSANFSTLNFWRKLYLVIMWLGAVSVLAFSVFAVTNSSSSQLSGVSVFQILILIVAVGLAIWTHYAIVRRAKGQVLALAIINLIPLGNIIGFLIMLSIWRVTKKEIEQFNIQKA